MKLVVTTIKADEPTKNGNIYSREVLERELKRNDTSMYFIRTEYPNLELEKDHLGMVPLKEAGGIVEDYSIEDNEIFIDIEVFSNTLAGKKINETIDYRLDMFGFGSKDEDGNIRDDYKLLYFVFTSEE